MFSKIVEGLELAVSVFREGSAPNTPRGRFNRRLQICIILIGVSFILPFAILPWEIISLARRLTAYLVSLVIIVGLIIFFTKRISIRCTNAVCNKVILGDARWFCLSCLQENFEPKLFSFLYKCQHCGEAPEGYICDHCPETIALRDQETEIIKEHCARKIYTPEDEAVSMDEAEKILSEPKIHKPGGVVKDIETAASQLNRVKNFKTARKEFKNFNEKITFVELEKHRVSFEEGLKDTLAGALSKARNNENKRKIIEKERKDALAQNAEKYKNQPKIKERMDDIINGVCDNELRKL